MKNACFVIEREIEIQVRTLIEGESKGDTDEDIFPKVGFKSSLAAQGQEEALRPFTCNQLQVQPQVQLL